MAALYKPNGTHTDHCHFYGQTGTAEIETLHKVWLRAIPDCVFSVSSIVILKNDPQRNRQRSYLPSHF
jgi:hypothetical protein